MYNLNKYQKIGIILTIIGAILYLTPILDPLVRFITQPILMGSSKGKDIILFLLMGFFLIFSEIENSKYVKNIKWPKILQRNKKEYTYIIFFALIILAIIGIITEIIIRKNMNISIFTIFNVMNPTITSTSILHSHIYKSVLGTILNSILTTIPTGIHTGSSLEPYIPEYIKFLFILIPILLILMLKAVQNRNFFVRIFLSLAFTLGIIGLIDGGLFSTPFIGSIYLLLIIKFDSSTFTYWIGKKIKSEWLKDIEGKKYIVKKINDYKNILIFALPHIILILIIILRLSIGFTGTITEYYEVDIANPSENIDLTTFNTIKIIKTDNHIIEYITPEYNEMELENNLSKRLNGKCEYYTLSWNTNSYFT